MRATVAIKKKLVQGYDLEPPVKNYYREKSIQCAKEELELWEGLYRSEMQNIWNGRCTLLMIGLGYCRSPQDITDQQHTNALFKIWLTGIWRYFAT